MKPLRIVSAAEEELRVAVTRYDSERIGLGARFLAEADRIVELIQHNP